MARGPEWHPEIVVDASLAASLIATQFPELGDVSIEELATGWDNTVFRVSPLQPTATQVSTWAFRFPRREIAVAGVRREMSLLPRLAPHLPLAIPVPRLLGEPSAAFPWPFFGAPLLAGDDMSVAPVTDSARGRAAAAVGSFLRALHRPALSEALGAGLGSDPMDRGFPKRRSTMTHERLHRLVKRNSWKWTSAVTELLDVADGLAAPAGAPVLVHGDLHVRHVLVDSDLDAVGVIDWGDACLADPAVDLSIAYSCFVGTARSALLDAYGGIDADRELRARALAVSLSAALADHAATVGEAALLSESIAGLHRSVT